MIRRERCIVMDVDGPLCLKKRPDQSYDEVAPNPPVVERLREYRQSGFYVILATSRNMNSYEGNTGLITANTAKILMAWLDRGRGAPETKAHPYVLCWNLARMGRCPRHKTIRGVGAHRVFSFLATDA